jgi:molybdopterin molybdotransferase
MISLSEAVDKIASISKTTSTKIIPIENSIGYICAKDIFATYFMPRFDNSAMDGFAVFATDEGKELKVVGKILAGEMCDMEISQGEAIKIMTGAVLPKGATCVVPQEKVQIVSDNTILVPNNLQNNANIRFAGEDIAFGDLLVKKGQKINFAIITLLASQGITHIEVFKKPIVAVFASGEELKHHWDKIADYQIYNSNTPTLMARCEELGCEVFFIASVRDNLHSIKEAISHSLNADILITSGGVSVGEADFTKKAFEELGFETIFSKVAIKPGKPVTFGKMKNTYVLNLPGNPLASSLVFEVLGRLLINKISGRVEIFSQAMLAKLKTSLKSGDVHEVIPGYFDGEFFEPTKKRSPGMINVLSKCNSYIIVKDTTAKLDEMSIVKVISFDFALLSNEKKEICSC